MVAKSIELSLKILGVSVKVWSNAEQALADPEILGADFYISDFSLPGLNGLQLLDAIQQRSVISINAVLVTGETSPEGIELTTSSPWTVLFKPVDLSALLAAMNEVMATERE
jgi:DNA-binding NtrC family response regulator